MKKLIALSGLLLMTALAVATPLGAMAFFLAAPGNYVVLGTAVEVSAITAYADEHKRDLIATLVNGLDIANDITVIPNVKNKIALTKLTIGDGLRPYAAAHEPKAGQLVFSDRYLETAIGKRDLLIDYRDFKSKHLAWRTRPGNAANKTINDMDFAPFVWNEVIKGVQREINDQVAYTGFNKADAAVYSEGATYAALAYIIFPVNGVNEYFQNISGSTTTAGQDPLDTPAKWLNVTARAVVPGLKSYIDAAITGGFSVTATGAVSDAATALAAFKTLFRSMPVPYKNWGVIIHASVTDCEYLMDALATRTQYVSADTASMISQGLIPIPETGGKGFAKMATWLGTSRRLIAEPMEMNGGKAYGLNLVMGTDLLSDAASINNIPDVYTIKSGITIDLGFQISDLSALRLGNQA